MNPQKSRPEAALQDQSGRAITQLHFTPLQVLVGWRFMSQPSRAVACLRSPDGSLTVIDSVRLVAAPEYMACLSEADQNEVRQMVLHRGVV